MLCFLFLVSYFLLSMRNQCNRRLCPDKNGSIVNPWKIWYTADSEWPVTYPEEKKVLYIMREINIGGRIRELRYKKGVTQETLAQAMSVTAQAVSKWEMGTSYPDFTLLPALAAYFEVSMDTLFDYDVHEVKEKIETVLQEARQYFFEDTGRYIETVKQALQTWPDNETLLTCLLDAYEYDLRDKGNTVHLEEMVVLADKIIQESRDFVRVCNVKDDKAAALLKLGRYEEAKAVLETLPSDVELRYDSMAFRLSGKDRRDAAIWARCSHLQNLYIACDLEGKGEMEIERYEEAIIAFTRGITVLEAFTFPEREFEDKYMWAGMQTFHWSLHMYRAACHKALGRTAECTADMEEAYEIIRTGWHDFAENPLYYLEYYNRYLAELGMEEYIQ